MEKCSDFDLVMEKCSDVGGDPVIVRVGLEPPHSTWIAATSPDLKVPTGLELG